MTPSSITIHAPAGPHGPLTVRIPHWTGRVYSLLPGTRSLAVLSPMPPGPLRGVCILLDSDLHQQPSEIRVCPTEDVLGTIQALAAEPGAPEWRRVLVLAQHDDPFRLSLRYTARRVAESTPVPAEVVPAPEDSDFVSEPDQADADAYLETAAFALAFLGLPLPDF